MLEADAIISVPPISPNLITQAPIRTGHNDASRLIPCPSTYSMMRFRKIPNLLHFELLYSSTSRGFALGVPNQTTKASASNANAKSKNRDGYFGLMAQGIGPQYLK